MKILSYEYEDATVQYGRFELGRVCLIVGNSGAGKSRLVNTIFNLALCLHQGIELSPGKFRISFEVNRKAYEYAITIGSSAQETTVVEERLSESGSETRIVDRTASQFLYRSAPLPKLNHKLSAIHLLREEELIAPISNGFARLVRRLFSGSELERSQALANMPAPKLAELQRDKGQLFSIAPAIPSLSLRLHLVHLIQPNLFAWIRGVFVDTFPFVKDVAVNTAHSLGLTHVQPETPVLVIKERGSADWISIEYMSSGMLKVLLILCDLATLQAGSVYIIDEYENSLGVNAIGFLPQIIDEKSESIQFIVTSHHPYLINNIPIENWYVLSRVGRSVRIKYGRELQERYGKSHQDAFTKLINDPFYLGD